MMPLIHKTSRIFENKAPDGTVLIPSQCTCPPCKHALIPAAARQANSTQFRSVHWVLVNLLLKHDTVSILSWPFCRSSSKPGHFILIIFLRNKNDFIAVTNLFFTKSISWLPFFSHDTCLTNSFTDLNQIPIKISNKYSSATLGFDILISQLELCSSQFMPSYLKSLLNKILHSFAVSHCKSITQLFSFSSVFRLDFHITKISLYTVVHTILHKLAPPPYYYLMMIASAHNHDWELWQHSYPDTHGDFTFEHFLIY